MSKKVRTSKGTAMLIRSRGGTNETQIPVSQIHIPDLWHIAQSQEDQSTKDAILECWHIAHDMRKQLQGETTQ